MAVAIAQFFHFVNTTFIWGIPIDHFVHVIVCFILFILFKFGLRLKTGWCFFFIFAIGIAKVWYSWGAIVDNGRYENPPMKMIDNGLGALGGYLLYRLRRSDPRRESRNRLPSREARQPR